MDKKNFNKKHKKGEKISFFLLFFLILVYNSYEEKKVGRPKNLFCY